MLIISEVIDALSWEAFNMTSNYDGEVGEDLNKLRDCFQTRDKDGSHRTFPAVKDRMKPLLSDYSEFLCECKEKSEMARFLLNIKYMIDILKCFIVADREGNWSLHVASVHASMCIFREFDAINYLRYGSYYLEKIKVLEAEHPELYRRFLMSGFVVRDHSDSFNAVSPDMKLEQTIQRASKSQGGIVGQTRNSAVVLEWELVFHEILLIQNNFRELTNVHVMSHRETYLHHELSGNKGKVFGKNVSNLLDFFKDTE